MVREKQLLESVVLWNIQSRPEEINGFRDKKKEKPKGSSVVKCQWHLSRVEKHLPDTFHQWSLILFSFLERFSQYRDCRCLFQFPVIEYFFNRPAVRNGEVFPSQHRDTISYGNFFVSMIQPAVWRQCCNLQFFLGSRTLKTSNFFLDYFGPKIFQQLEGSWNAKSSS